MIAIVPTEGATFIQEALRASLPGGLYIACTTAATSELTITTMPEVVPVTGTYNRLHCPVANLTISGRTLTCTGTFTFTGFTSPEPITHVALVTSADGSGKLICMLPLRHRKRILSDTQDQLRVINPSFQMV
jgi:hypothetical protein